MTTTVIIELNKLDADPKNVRKTYSADSIAKFAANIEANGVLHNLLVRPGAKKGRYFVTAGERRRKALLLLVEQGKIEKNHPVECKVKTAEEATEISLSENVEREAMLGSVSRLSCWIRTAVMVVGDIRGAYRGRHTDVRVKRSRSVARTTLEAAATPQAF